MPLDINALIADYENKSSKELLKVIEENFSTFKKLYLKVEKDKGIDLGGLVELTRNINFTIAFVVAHDGEIDDKEYKFYKDSAKLIAVPSDSIFSKEAIMEIDEETREKILDSLIALTDSLSTLSGPEAKESLFRIILAGFSSNGVISSKEEVLLNRFYKIDANSVHGNNKSNNDEDQTSGEFQKIALKKFGWSYKQDDDTYYISLGAELFNPNLKAIAQGTIVKVICYDKNNSIVGSTKETIEYMDPNTIFNFGVELRIESDTKPDTVKLLIQAEKFEQVEANTKVMSGVTLSRFKLGSGSYPSFTGQIESKYSKKIDYMTCYVVFRNASNEILGGANFSHSDLFPKSEDGFDTSLNFVPSSTKTVDHSVDFDLRDLL